MSARFLVPQSWLKVLSAGNWLSFLVLKAEGEVSNQPHEGRKGVDELLRVVLVVVLMQHFSEIDNQTQIFDSLLVDAADTIIDEIGGKEDGHEEYLNVCVLSLFEWAQSLGVDDYAVFGALSRVDLDDFRPHPESFGAGIDGRPHLKTAISAQ